VIRRQIRRRAVRSTRLEVPAADLVETYVSYLCSDESLIHQYGTSATLALQIVRNGYMRYIRDVCVQKASAQSSKNNLSPPFHQKMSSQQEVNAFIQKIADKYVDSAETE
jgi:hypothetical protein